MNRAEIYPSQMTVEEIRAELKPTEYTVACNPDISDELKGIISDIPAHSHFGSSNTKCYYTNLLVKHLVHEPFGCADISEVSVNELFMLEKAYDILIL